MSSIYERLPQRLGLTLSSLVCVLRLVFAGFFTPLTLRKRDLSGKIAIVTGANSGLGYSIALSLAEQGATVYLACRNEIKAADAAEKIIHATRSKSVHVVQLDTSSLKSVRQFAKSWSEPIDYLMHNAGIATTPSDVKTTPEGLGLLYATNVAGSFLLTSLLESKLTSDARVVFTSSTGALSGSLRSLFTMPRLVPVQRSDSLIYSDTKLQQVAFARALQDRWDRTGSNRRAHAFTPGYAVTEIFGKVPDNALSTDLLFYLLKIGTKLAISADQGAVTGVWLATSNDPVVRDGGGFWDRKQKMLTPVDIVSSGQLERIWQLWSLDSGATWD